MPTIDSGLDILSYSEESINCSSSLSLAIKEIPLHISESDTSEEEEEEEDEESYDEGMYQYFKQVI
jgi:hypothetical protein